MQFAFSLVCTSSFSILGVAQSLYGALINECQAVFVETKGNDKMNDRNVRQKQTATMEWVRKINSLKPEERMNRVWEYVLLSEDNFYALSANGATITDICNINKVSMSQLTGNLFS